MGCTPSGRQWAHALQQEQLVLLKHSQYIDPFVRGAVSLEQQLVMIRRGELTANTQDQPV
jgi:hypothetical protein